VRIVAARRGFKSLPRVYLYLLGASLDIDEGDRGTDRQRKRERERERERERKRERDREKERDDRRRKQEATIEYVLPFVERRAINLN